MINCGRERADWPWKSVLLIFHVITGVGFPSATHSTTIRPLAVTSTSRGSWLKLGGTVPNTQGTLYRYTRQLQVAAAAATLDKMLVHREKPVGIFLLISSSKCWAIYTKFFTTSLGHI